MNSLPCGKHTTEMWNPKFTATMCILTLGYGLVSATRISAYQATRLCGRKNFRCNSGQCISDYDLCDGKPDCNDGSDETETACQDIHCPKFIYKCSYGACVKSRAKCDGYNDCIDGSDEKFCNTATTVPTVPSTIAPEAKPTVPVPCTLPNDPPNGYYAIGGKSGSPYWVGDLVPPFSVLVTTCEDGYRLASPDTIYSVCANGIWTPIPSTCLSYSIPQPKPSKPLQCRCYC